ncbi:NAD(P)-binding protein [Caenimonas koreensis DSM 17982]|uniref:NAD(P)-binding protein n=1 Tax=Caenimonas koreensis DSM 17982 TaxID=1121255 RepID=A0A844AWL7_9BURK|nr:NAD(P)-binding protein [Caenimonas koreensis]MRD48910.1 NAD(P)-binding protein [Caenimonas koreensis DSM 17982]
METDYLIIGSGAVGMAFADTLLDECDAHITIVDRHSKPGGHWNDAYSFVGLHQPSAYYGVNSTELGSRRIDDAGPNKGLYEMASGPEINTYYDKLMTQRFLPSGRVSYHPMSEYAGDGRIVSLLSGAQTQVEVRRKTVDATWFSPNVPSTHTPKFAVGEGVRVMPPNALPQLWLEQQGNSAPRQFCVLGAGKTAMDTVVWLLRNGAAPDAIQWVVPRDSWIVNRLQTQPGLEFFNYSVGGEADKLEAFAQAQSIDELFLRLEALGQMLRIDTAHMPTMFHYATISTGEVDLLRTVRRVIRMGRVQSITRDAMELEHGRVAMEPATLYVDCTASAIRREASQPVFQGSRIAIQLLRAPLVVLSAAQSAYIEVHGDDDEGKNAVCKPVPFPNDLAGYARATQVSMMNQMAWSQDPARRQWLRDSRLDGFSRMVSELDKSDAERLAVLGRIRAASMTAVPNMHKLAKPAA